MIEQVDMSDKLLSPKPEDALLTSACSHVAGASTLDTPSHLPDQENYLQQFLQSISASSSASNISSPQPPALTTLSATPSEMGDISSYTNSGNVSPRRDMSPLSASVTGVNTPIPAHGESAPSASAAQAALRLLSVITSVQSGQGAAGVQNAAFKLPIPSDDANALDGNNNLAAALAAVMAAAQQQQQQQQQSHVPVLQDDRQRSRTSSSDDLSKTIRELELEDTLLMRLEREYNEDKRELSNYEAKVSSIERDIDRYVKQIQDIEVALMSKRELLSKSSVEKNEVASMVNFLRERLETKNEMMVEKAAKIESLKQMLPYDSEALKRLKEKERDRHYGRERERQRESASSLGKRPRDVSPVKPPSVMNACYGYNSTGVCRRQNCLSEHVCLLCGRKHPMGNCDSERAICVKFNMEECPGGCHRDHRCLRCGSKDHRLVDCPIPVTPGVEFCFAWNSSNGVCKMPGCFRTHSCMRCQGPHSVVCCPENIDVYWSEARRGEVTRRPASDYNERSIEPSRHEYKKPKSDDHNAFRLSDKERRQVCRDWNNGRCSDHRDKCKFKHICLKCGDSAHPEKRCPLAVPPARR